MSIENVHENELNHEQISDTARIKSGVLPRK